MYSTRFAFPGTLPAMARRKSSPEAPLLPLVGFHPPSNGEFSPLPPPPRAERALSLWQDIVEAKHHRLGMTRRDFATSASGTAAALWAIFGLNAARVYGVDVEATRYAIDDDDDVAGLRTAYRQDPGSCHVPSRYAYTGPRTRREFLRLQALDPHPPRRG